MSDLETKNPSSAFESNSNLLIMGQIPPPWHGQAVATKILFEADWNDYGINTFCLPMAYSKQMNEVGRFSWHKITHCFELIAQAKKYLRTHSNATLLYPPASAAWLPFLRDVLFLCATRKHAKRTIFIYHASGLGQWCITSMLRKKLAQLAYGNADYSLEVGSENLSPHEAFTAKKWIWCPCGVDVPNSFSKKQTSSKKFQVLYVGSLQEGKGILDILKTAYILKSQGIASNFEFKIIGNWFSTEFKLKVEAFMKKLSLDNSYIKIVGGKTGDEKWQAFADADVFFFPTHYSTEASPLVLMEALGMGLPILSTNWAAIPKMFQNCPAAATLLNVDDELPLQAAKKLTEFYQNTELHSEKNKIMRIKFYNDNFTEEKFINRILTAIQG